MDEYRNGSIDDKSLTSLLINKLKGMNWNEEFRMKETSGHTNNLIIDIKNIT